MTTPTRREYHANGTYWSGVPTIDMPCDFCGLSITDHDPRTHACIADNRRAQNDTPVAVQRVVMSWFP